MALDGRIELSQKHIRQMLEFVADQVHFLQHDVGESGPIGIVDSQMSNFQDNVEDLCREFMFYMAMLAAKAAQ